MASTNFNPGEPVFNQATGEPYIDPRTGDAVEVAPNSSFIDPLTGVRYDADDVSNAAYLRVNTRVGEVRRDQSKGVDYVNLVFAGNVGIDVAIAEVGAAIRSTPGVQSIKSVQALSINTTTRAAAFRYSVIKRSGEQTSAITAIAG